MENESRSDRFKKNAEVEDILQLLEHNLSPIEETLTAEHNASSYPTIFIFGCARSGTTVLHQYLIQNIKCIYPTNFISRFYYAPYLGGLYYKMFTELDERGELLGGVNKKEQDLFSSRLGKTEGVHSPNEFWYFWRKHFHLNSKETIKKNEVNQQKAHRFRNSIFALQNLFEGPFITKGMIANNCIDLVESLFPKAIFIFIKRDIFANAKSLFKAREAFFGTAEKWYSFYPKPPNTYENMPAVEQVVWQVKDTNEEIKQSLDRCENGSVIEVNYEEFCQDPKQLLDALHRLSPSLNIAEEPSPSHFSVREKKNLANGADQKIKAIIEKLTL